MTQFGSAEVIDDVLYLGVAGHCDSVLWAVILELKCRHCDKQGRWRARSQAAAAKVARLAGWKLTDNNALCPTHSGLTAAQFHERRGIIPTPPPPPPPKVVAPTASLKPSKQKRVPLPPPPHCTFPGCKDPIYVPTVIVRGSKPRRCEKHLQQGREGNIRHAAKEAGIVLTPYLITLQLERLKNGEGMLSAKELREHSVQWTPEATEQDQASFANVQVNGLYPESEEADDQTSKV